MSEMIQLETLPVETLAEMANEAAAACEASGRKTVEHAATCGRALLAIRPQIPHGEWLDWLKENFHQSRQRAQQFMEIANCYARSNLESAETIQGALRMIAASPEKQAKKQEREAKKQEQQPEKAEAPPKPTALELTRQRLEVAQRMATSAPQPQPERPAWLADPDEMGLPLADDLPPQPKTNIHYTPENRRQPDARETDRQGLVTIDDPRDYVDGAWYRFDESMGRLFWVTDDAVLAKAKEIGQARGLWLVFSEPIVSSGAPTPDSHDTTPTVQAKPGKVPTVTQLTEMLVQRSAPGNWPLTAVEMIGRWAAHKQSLTGKAKIRTEQQWETALSRMENVAAVHGWPAVADMIEKAIANGWQGWEHATDSGRKSAPVAPHRTYTRLNKPEIKYDELPE